MDTSKSGTSFNLSSRRQFKVPVKMTILIILKYDPFNMGFNLLVLTL